MKRLILICFVILPTLLSPPSELAQVFTLSREDMIKFTAKNPYDRFPDGRPKVPEQILEKVRGLSSEETWCILIGEKFTNEYEDGFQVLHPAKKLVGRAVTAKFMPFRPDVADVSEAEAMAKGLPKTPNQRVIDMLQPNDVLVVDLFGKIQDGTFVGDNLASAIYSLSKTGFVIDGAIRDLEGILPLDLAGYFRAAHPSAIGGVMLTGVNIPIRIGKATVMPGDIVLGDREGVTFIPPQLIENIFTKAEEVHIHDEWTKNKFLTGKYKSSELYPTPSDPAFKKEYDEYLKIEKEKK